jgi:mRNA interferase MazF
MEGKIILAVFPQDKEQKLRPALVLREFPKYGDLLICGISSNVNQYIPEFDLLLNATHPDFQISGLRLPGVCRLNMLTMLSRREIVGSIGEISLKTHNSLLQTLAHYLCEYS